MAPRSTTKCHTHARMHARTFTLQPLLHNTSIQLQRVRVPSTENVCKYYVRCTKDYEGGRTVGDSLLLQP
jgi:hypothetical protein